MYVGGVPAISSFVVNQLPEGIDIQVGREVRKEILKNTPIDEEKTALLNAFYSELNYDSETKLYVVRSDEFNAFAVPDNSIFVLSKVFDDVKTYPQLAALLGHEYSHIKNRHGMKLIAQTLSWELLATIFTDNESDNFVRNANKLLTLSNSREFELEADNFGLDLLQKNKINLNGMIEMLQITEQIPNNTDRPPVYLSTHPDTEDRIKKIQTKLNSQNNNFADNEKLQDIFNALTKEN